MSAQAAELAAQQRALLALVKGRPVPAGNDSYFDLVRSSRGLTMLQMITAWWRRFDLEQRAPLTSRALTHAGRFEGALTRLGHDAGTPAAISALVLHFLDQHAEDTDSLIAAVASTERALTLARRGDRSPHEVRWDRDQAPVLNALLAGRPPGTAAPGDFRLIVSHDRPALITIERRDDPQAELPTGTWRLWGTEAPPYDRTRRRRMASTSDPGGAPVTYPAWKFLKSRRKEQRDAPRRHLPVPRRH